MANQPENWYNALFQGERYNHLLNNTAETFNKWVKPERDMPILALLDCIWMKIMIKMNKARRASKNWDSYLIPEVNDWLNELTNQSRGLLVAECNENVVEVVSEDGHLRMNLTDLTCTCRMWQIEGTPCIHACAAISANGGSPAYACRGDYWTT